MQDPASRTSEEDTAAEAEPVWAADQPPEGRAPATGVSEEPGTAELLAEAVAGSGPAGSGEAVVGVSDSRTPPAALGWIDFFKPAGIPYALLILVVMTALGRLVSRESERLAERFADRRLMIQQTGSFMGFLVYVFGLMAAVFTLFDLTDQMLLAIGGSAAVAAGFALKDIVASVVAGVIILIDRPFQTGDRVTFAGYYGEITHIGLRSVRLNTLDDTQVSIPNNLFLTQAVASGNAGAVDMMIQVDLFIGVDQDLDEARRLLGEVVTTSRYVNLNRKWAVLAEQVIEQNYLALRLRAKAYVLDARLEKAFQGDITERALRAFRSSGILPPAVLHRDVGSD